MREMGMNPRADSAEARPRRGSHEDPLDNKLRSWLTSRCSSTPLSPVGRGGFYKTLPRMVMRYPPGWDAMDRLVHVPRGRGRADALSALAGRLGVVGDAVADGARASGRPGHRVYDSARGAMVDRPFLSICGGPAGCGRCAGCGRRGGS